MQGEVDESQCMLHSRPYLKLVDTMADAQRVRDEQDYPYTMVIWVGVEPFRPPKPLPVQYRSANKNLLLCVTSLRFLL